MKNIYSIVLTIAACVISANAAFSQSDSSGRKSYFTATTYYLSNAVYSGRKDSIPVPYIKTAITYVNKSGISVSAGTSTLVSAASPVRLDAFWLDAGYDFSIGSKVNGGINLSKTFYSDASFSVTSEIKAEGGAYLSYDAKLLTLNGSTYLMYSQAMDISVSAGVSHSFQKGNWSFVPDLSVGMGTQSFYQAYVQNRKSTNSNSGKGRSRKGGGSSTGGTTTVQSTTFTQQNRFSILDYELTGPVTFEKKDWTFYLQPTYAIPVNAATYTINNQLAHEPLSNSLFVEIGAKVKF